MTRIVHEIWMIGLALLLTGCTEGLLEVKKDEGHIIVSPDWQAYSLPSLATCHFYSETGTTTSHVYREVAADIFSCSLPPGVYRLLAYNTDIEGVEFVAQENIDCIAARLISDVQPGELYVWDVSRMEVLLRDTLYFSPAPRPLVKTLCLNFRLTGIENIKNIEGALYGVYPSVCLLTGKPSAESITAAPGTSVSFVAEIRQKMRAADCEGVSYVHLFGLLDPQCGEHYDNRLQLNLHLKGGEVRPAEVDMNEAFSDILAQNGGEIPTEVPVEIEIEIKWIGTGLAASVKQWSIGKGEGGV